MVTTWPLRNGPDLPASSVQFALELESAGHELAAHVNEKGVTELRISLGSTLTPEQWAGIKQHRKAILALLAYQAPEAR